MYRDVGGGVMGAEASRVGDRALEGSTWCEPALISFLRAHEDARIAGLIALDGTRRGRDDESPPSASTVSLLVLLADDPMWPRAELLLLDRTPCDEDCAASFIQFRSKLDSLKRSIAVASIAETVNANTSVRGLLWISMLKK